MSPQKLITKKIGELLIERAIISEKQLGLALAKQRESGGYVSQHLISMGFASETDIASCLSSQYNFAYLPLNNYDFSAAVLKTIPFKLLEVFSVIPVDKVGNSLSVAMADPLNEGVIDMIAEITKCEIAVFISTYSDIRKAIEKYFPDELKLLKRKRLSDELAAQKNFVSGFIQTTGYKGAERRRSKRVEIELPMVYFHRSRVMPGRIQDISLNGISFFAQERLGFGQNIYTNIIFRVSFSMETSFNAVVQIVRTEALEEAKRMGLSGKSAQYSYGGFFNFMTDEDKSKLTDFLSKRTN